MTFDEDTSPSHNFCSGRIGFSMLRCIGSAYPRGKPFEETPLLASVPLQISPVESPVVPPACNCT